MKEAVSRKKEAHMAKYQDSTEENNRRYKSMKIKEKSSIKSNEREGGRGAYCITELPKFDALASKRTEN